MNKSELFTQSNKQSFVSTRNACKLCSPLGASIAFRGIEGCVPLIHGSQGCSTYIRRYVISHFREPIDIASSNFSEESAIFGGSSNFKTALDNVVKQYQPNAIGVATTCLSETIGDDISRYLIEYRTENGNNTPVIIHASTPSYSGTHMEGFRSALRATVEQLAEKDDDLPHNGINIIASLLSAEDLRYIKEICEEASIPCTLLPDYSESLDGESWDTYKKIPEGGTPIESIRLMGNAAGTIELGAGIPDRKSVARYLDDSFGVDGTTINIPVGIEASDAFFAAIEKYSARTVHPRHKKERGRLVDAYIDAHKYLFGVRAVLYGEADLVAGLASFMSEIGVKVVLCATGARESDLTADLGRQLAEKGALLSDDTDFATMLERARSLSPDIVIGNSKGFYLSKNLGIPIVRCGFPVHDRFGGQRIQHIGYRGTQQLLDRIVNALLEQRQESSAVGYSYM
jgi:nitrogenase molybdenum-iron protein NifN